MQSPELFLLQGYIVQEPGVALKQICLKLFGSVSLTLLGDNSGPLSILLWS